jgi:outer membrane protein assembly factor BamB
MFLMVALMAQMVIVLHYSLKSNKLFKQLYTMQKLSLLFIYCFITFSLASCQREGMRKAPRAVWTYNAVDEGLNTEISVYDGIVHNNNCIISTTFDKKSQIEAISAEGVRIWQWSDFANSIAATTFNIGQSYKKDNLLMCGDSYYIYCINLDNGTTMWRKEMENISSICGSGDKFYIGAPAQDQAQNYLEYALYEGNIYTGEMTQISVPPYAREFPTESIYIRYIERTSHHVLNEQPVLMVPYSEPFLYPNYYTWRNKYGVFDLTTKQWKYANKFLESDSTREEGLVTRQAVVQNDKVFYARAASIVCHSVQTGEPIWKKYFSEILDNVKMIDGKLVVLGSENGIYALDTDGNQVWQGISGGNCSGMEFHNGVIYFTSKGDGKLHAIDVSNGKELMGFVPTKSDNNSSFDQVVRIMPRPNKKALVVVSTYTTVYAYEAVR